MIIGFSNIGWLQYQSKELQYNKRMERITAHLSNYFSLNDIDFKQLKHEPQTELNRLIERYYRKDAPSYVDTNQLKEIYKISFATINNDLREYKAFKPQTEKDFEIHTNDPEIIAKAKILNEAAASINKLIDLGLIGMFHVGSLSRGFNSHIIVDTSNCPKVIVNAHALTK